MDSILTYRMLVAKSATNPTFVPSTDRSKEKVNSILYHHPLTFLLLCHPTSEMLLNVSQINSSINNILIKTLASYQNHLPIIINLKLMI